MLYDISVPIEDRLVTWPGDPGITVERVLDLAKEDPATVSMLHMGSHTGTHVDAFSHFKKDGLTLDQMDLDIYIGDALVVEIQNSRRITRDELETYDLEPVERILFKTRNSETEWNREPFNEHFCHLTPDAADYLIEQGIILVGIDYLSVEGYHAKTLYEEDAPVHHRLLDAGIYIVEGLYLNHVPPGWYELICLPLKIKYGDGAPARAVLRTLED